MNEISKLIIKTNMEKLDNIIKNLQLVDVPYEENTELKKEISKLKGTNY